MRWPRDATGWPMSEHSRLVLCRPHRWHLQEAGTGPTDLLIHGAGGATQSFRGLFPLLARHRRVVAIDLPGQGFTQSGARGRLGLDEMTADLAALLAQEGIRPDRIIGHSAGAAIALALTLPPHGVAAPVVGINAALGTFKGVAGWLFPLLARTLAAAPFSAALFSATATEAGIRNLIDGTGSTLPPDGVSLYLRLAQDRGHVDGTLGMMAAWKLEPLLARLPDIAVPVHLIAGEADRAVPPQTSTDAVRRIPGARLTLLPGLGHLMHEEDPQAVLRAMDG